MPAHKVRVTEFCITDSKVRMLTSSTGGRVLSFLGPMLDSHVRTVVILATTSDESRLPMYTP